MLPVLCVFSRYRSRCVTTSLNQLNELKLPDDALVNMCRSTHLTFCRCWLETGIACTCERACMCMLMYDKTVKKKRKKGGCSDVEKDAVAMETAIPAYVSKKQTSTHTCVSKKNSERGCMLLHKSTVSYCCLALMLNISLQSQSISIVNLQVVVDTKEKPQWSTSTRNHQMAACRNNLHRLPGSFFHLESYPFQHLLWQTHTLLHSCLSQVFVFSFFWLPLFCVLQTASHPLYLSVNLSLSLSHCHRGHRRGH